MKHIEIIAEIGINHQGDMDLATWMIRAAKECGADVAKFQIYTPSVILDPTHPLLAPWWELIEATELDFEKAKTLKGICDEAGIEFLASVFEPEKVAWTEELGVQRYKIAARSVYDDALLAVIGKTGKPVIASISELYQRDVVPPFGQYGIKPERLYCVSEYPAPLSSLEFGWPDIFSHFAGFSDHTAGITASVVAMSLGARIIEKHFTLYRGLPGPDHVCSIELSDLTTLCQMRDEIEEIYGN